MSFFSYQLKYDSPQLRGQDITTRPWNLKDEIISNSRKGSSLLDLGCGTAFKLFPLANHFSEIVGIDIVEEMVCAARSLISKAGYINIRIMQGDNNNLAFPDNSFDTVTCMLSNWNAKEIARVLKPDGDVIIEHVGCEDKMEFKKIFGRDEDGWRGQFINLTKQEFLQSFHDSLNPFFYSVLIKNGFWETCYSEAGIKELLLYTPAIRNFDEIRDRHFFETACNKLKCEHGIKLVQNRILIHAKNIRNI